MFSPYFLFSLFHRSPKFFLVWAPLRAYSARVICFGLLFSSQYPLRCPILSLNSLITFRILSSFKPPRLVFIRNLSVWSFGLFSFSSPKFFSSCSHMHLYGPIARMYLITSPVSASFPSISFNVGFLTF